MAVEPGDATFVSKLDEAGKKKAKDELNELNDKDRELAVQSLRRWVLEQDWLKSPTDFEFLLRFIRVRKYSQLAARESLENYWTNRTKTPAFFHDVDPADPEIQRIIRLGVCLCPKVYDKHGRRVSFGRMDYDFNQFKKKGAMEYLYKTCCLIFDYLSWDENVQVHGLVFMSDFSGISLDFLKIWNPEYEKKLMQYFEKSLPIRLKGTHMYAVPTFFDAVYTLMSPFMSQKIKDRMHLHGRSLVKIYDELGMASFPDEYLPDDYEGPSAGSCKDIADAMIADMMRPEFRNYMLELSSGKYGVDLEKKKKSDNTPVASFRKLNVD